MVLFSTQKITQATLVAFVGNAVSVDAFFLKDQVELVVVVAFIAMAGDVDHFWPF